MTVTWSLFFIGLSVIAVGLFLAGGWCVLPGHTGQSGVAVCNATVGTLDRLGAPFATEHFSPAVLASLIFITSLGDPTSIILFAAVSFIVLISIAERRLAAYFLLILLIGDALVLAAKDFFDRLRPIQSVYTFARFGSSYPSAHAFVSLVFYGFVGYILIHHTDSRLIKITVAIAGILLIAAIGFSRVALDFHWFSDVVGGWLLGFPVLVILIATYRLLHRRIRGVL